MSEQIWRVRSSPASDASDVGYFIGDPIIIERFVNELGFSNSRLHLVQPRIITERNIEDLMDAKAGVAAAQEQLQQLMKV